MNEWRPGDESGYGPTGELFLRKLAEAGFATLLGKTGLMLVSTEERSLVVVHLGLERRWEITLREGEADKFRSIMIGLPERVEACIAWLSGESLERVQELLGPSGFVAPDRVEMRAERRRRRQSEDNSFSD